jgi:hypothetical protein
MAKSPTSARPGASTTPKLPGDDFDDFDANRPPPVPDLDRMLYGLVGKIARAGAQGTAANPVAIGVNSICFLGAMAGRDVCRWVGDTAHHPRFITCHVGRTSVGGKGEAIALLERLEAWLRAKDSKLLGPVHKGGLSTLEGLIELIHDGYSNGKEVVAAINDKRLLVIDHEFGSPLTQFKRPGNLLSFALRECWDGVTLAPATKYNKISATDPHVCLAAAGTPSEIKPLIEKSQITNGFANRILLAWAERTCLVAIPQPVPEDVLAALGEEVVAFIAFAKGDYPAKTNARAMTLTPAAEARYKELYLTRLTAPEETPVLDSLLQRRAPMLLRLAMLFALTDQTLEIDVQHIDAGMAWIQYGEDSVRFLFGNQEELKQAARVEQLANNIGV